MPFCIGPTVITAERFSSSIVSLVRSNYIRTIELLSAAEHPTRDLLTVTAQLTSAFSWKHQGTQEIGEAASTEEHKRHEAAANGTIFIYHIIFFHSSNRAAPSHDPMSDSSGPHVRLSAWWCAELQRQLAVCSALTGQPTRFSVSLLPFVPALQWERGPDGILGAMHCAVMSSTIDENHMDPDTVHESALAHENIRHCVNGSGKRSGETSEEKHRRQYILQAALLLNANIPLGPRAMKNTAVLVLHAPDGDLCTAQSAHVFGSTFFSQSTVASSPLSQKLRKRRCEMSQSVGYDDTNHSMKDDANGKKNNVNDGHGCSGDSFYALLSQFTAQSLLPALSWNSVWSHPRSCEVTMEDRSPQLEDTHSHCESKDKIYNPNDVCGLGRQLGCSFYLDGRLDPRSVQSITIILNIPRALWHRLMPWLRYDCSTESMHTNGTQRMPPSRDTFLTELWEQLPQRVAKTIEGALTRLVAENLDCFLRCSTRENISGHMSGTQAALEEKSYGEGKVQQSWQLLAQSIADSLAQIVRTSQNPVFVEEVHRLLQPLKRDDAEIGAAFSSGATLSSSSASSQDATAALLRWAVETRLTES